MGITLLAMSKRISPKRDEPLRTQGCGAKAGIARLSVAGCLILAMACLRADQVEMQNGDRYVGTVLSMSADALVLQNDVLGTVKLPRGKVAHITMGPAATAETTAQPPRTNHPWLPRELSNIIGRSPPMERCRS